MPDLAPYLARRSLARPGGVGGGGAAPQPRLGDGTGGLFAAQRAIGQELSEAADVMGQLALQSQRARDAATLAQAEGTLSEQLGLAYNAMAADQSIDPWEYGSRMQQTRQQLVESLGKGMSSRLGAQWQAHAARASDGLIVKADAAGKQEGIKRAHATLETTTDTLLRAQVAETDPGQRAILDQQIRDLHAGYVSSGLLSPQDATQRLIKAKDQATVYRYDAWIRTDPDAAVTQLEQGLAANPDVPLEAYGKLVDQARRVQSERFHFAEAQEAKVRRDTEAAQKDQEAIAFGQIQKGQLSRASLDQLRDRREISPGGYETMVRYLDTKAREDRAEARQAKSLALQQQEAGYRETESRLSVLAMTGELDQEGIINFAKSHQLPARAIDGALAKAQTRQQAQQSEYGRAQNQAEQLISKAFTKGPFEVLEPVTAQAYSAALDELTRRSRAFPGGKEDPIAVAQELIPRYQASLSADDQVKLDGLTSRLKFATPDALEAARPTIPATLYQEQRKLFKDVDDVQQRLQRKANPPAAKAKAPGYIERAWEWWMKPSGGGRQPDTSGLEGK